MVNPFVFLHNIVVTAMLGILSPRLAIILFRHCNVEIWFERANPQSAYVYRPRPDKLPLPLFIRLGLKDLNKQQIVTALLHEIGHYIDFKKDIKNIKCHTKSTEKRAWKIAIQLADKYGIKLDADLATAWLKSYGATSTKLKQYSKRSHG